MLPLLTTEQTGFFWFFNAENIELAAKVLDGRGLNGRHWLLYGGLSDVEYTLTATDTVTGLSKTYRQRAGQRLREDRHRRLLAACAAERCQAGSATGCQGGRVWGQTWSLRQVWRRRAIAR